MLTKEQAIAAYDRKRKGTVQNSAAPKNTLTKEQAIAVFDAKKRERERDRIISEVISREKTYESAIPDEYKGILGAADYLETSKKGASIENPSYNDAAGFTLGQWRFGNKPINNIVTFSRDNADDIALYEGVNEGVVEGVGKYNYRFLTDEEVGVYNYLLGSGDNERAAKYLEDMNDVLEQRHGAKLAKGAESNFFTKALYSAGSGANRAMRGFKDIPAMINGGTGSSPAAIEYASDAIRSEAGGLERFAYDLADTTGYMLPSILVGNVIGGVGGGIAIGTSAAGNGYSEMRRLGYSENQARGYGVLVGASESVLSTLLGGIGALGNKTLGKAVTKLLTGLDNAAARLAIKFGETAVGKVLSSMGSEALEEGLQTALEPFIKMLTTGEDFEGIDLAEVLYSALLGAVSAGMLEGPGAVASGIVKNQALTDYGNRITMLEDNEENLFDAAKASEIEEIVKLAERMNATPQGNKRSRLVGELALKVEEEAAKRGKDRYESTLTAAEAQRLGMNPIDYYADETPSEFDEAIDDYAYNRKNARSIESELSKKAESVRSSKYTAYNERYGGELGRIYRKNYTEWRGTGLEFALYTEMARNLGMNANGMSFTDAIKTLPKTDREGILSLPTELIDAAFRDGTAVSKREAEFKSRRDAAYKALEARRKNAEAKSDGNTESENDAEKPLTDEERSNVIKSKKLKSSNLNATQKRALAKIEALAKVLDGFTFSIETGEEFARQHNARGYFRISTNTIHLNIDAGKINGVFDYAVESALEHELGHTIKEYSPRMYEELRDYIKANYYNEAQWSAIVRRRLEQYRKIADSFTYEQAEEEVVCNSLGKIINSERAVTKLSEEKPNIFKRVFRLIKEFFKKLLPKNRSYAFETTEERVVADYLSRKDAELEALFIRALKAANENARAANVLRDEARAKNAVTAKNEAVTNTESDSMHVTGDNDEKAPATANTNVDTDTRFALTDEAYLAAVESGDMDTAQAMVDEAAKKAGYNNKGFHGTDAYEDFTIFKKGKYGYLGPGIYFSEDESYAKRYATKNGYAGKIYSAYLKIENPLLVTSDNPAVEILGEKTAQRREAQNSLATHWITSADIKKLQTKGYDGIAWEYGGNTEYSVWNSNQVKSADPVTYDKNGKIIPLSKRFNENERDIRYSLPEAPIVNLDEDSELRAAVKNVYGSKKYKIITNYIFDLLGNRVVALSDGRSAIVDHRDASHISSNAADKKVAQISKIEALIKNAQPYAYADKVEHNKFDYFVYYAVNVKYDGEIFPIYLNVGKAFTDKKWHIYDITNEIRETADRINGLEQLGRNPGGALTNDLSDTIIPYSAEIINPSDEKSAKKSSKKRFALPETDSNGETLTEAQREYFADSKVLDENGNLLALYHGTPKENGEFYVFDNNKAKRKGGFGFASSGKGFYFTTKREAAEIYTRSGGRLLSVYVDIKNPYIVNGDIKEQISNDFGIDPLNVYLQEVRRILSSKGYDGIIQGRGDAQIVVAYYPEQIKLTSNKNPTADPDIRYSLNDRLSREALAGAFEGLAETDEERGIIKRYLSEIDNIDVRIDDRRAMIARLEELKGVKGMGAERARLNAHIRDANDYITRHDESLLKLAAAKPFKDVVERYQKRQNATIESEDINKLTFSQGAFNQAVAKYTKRKMYTKREAQKAVDNVYGVQKLTLKTRDEIYNELWEGFNALDTASQREKFADDKARRILDAIVAEAEVLNPDFVESREKIAYFKDYVGRLSFSDDLKEEIQHKYDKQGSRSMLGRWGNKHSDKAPIPTDVFVTSFARENPGYDYLEDMATIDALEVIDGIYEEAKSTEFYIDEYADASGSELAEIRNQLKEGILNTFEYGGTQTEIAKSFEEIEQKRQRDRKRFDDLIEQNRARLELDRVSRMIRDKKLGTFENATQIGGNSMAGLLRDLSRFEWRKTFTPSDARDKVRALLDWYTPEQPALGYVKDKTDGMYIQAIRDNMQAIADGRGSLTSSELWDLADILKHLVHVAESYNKVWYQGKWIDAIETSKRYIAKLKETKALEGSSKLIKPIADVTKAYADLFLDPLAIAHLHDRAVEGGVMSEIIDMLQAASVDNEIAYSDVMRDYYDFHKENPDYARKTQLETIRIYGHNVPKNKAIALYMTLKQPDAQRGFVEHGFDFYAASGELRHARNANQQLAVDFKKQLVYDQMISKKKTEKEAEELANAAVSEGFNSDLLTPEELDAFVSRTRDEIETKLNELDKRLIEIEERGFNGTLREMKRTTDINRMGYSNAREGYYFPIRRAGIAKRLEELTYLDELQSVSNISANKDRTPGASQALVIDDHMQVFERHARAICSYAALQPFVDYFEKVYYIDSNKDTALQNNNDPDNVAKIADSVWGKHSVGRKLAGTSFHQYLKYLLEDVQGIKTGRDNWLTDAVAKIRGGVARSALSLNGKVLFSQLSSYGTSFHLLSSKALKKGMSAISGKTNFGTFIFSKAGQKKLAEIGAEVDEYCPFARIRNEDNHVYLAQSVVEKNGKYVVGSKVEDALTRFSDILMTPIGTVDRAVICTLFEACKIESATEAAPIGSEENLKNAGALLERVILETQQTNIATTKSEAMRSNNELTRAITMFTSDSMRTASRLFEAVTTVVYTRRALTRAANPAEKARIEARLKKANKMLVKSATVVVINAAYMAAITLAFRALRGKIKDDENLIVTLSNDFFNGFFAGLPLVSDAISQLTGGYGMSHYALDFFSDLLGSLRSISTRIREVIFEGGDIGKLFGAMRTLIFNASQIIGMPARNLWNIIFGIWKMIHKESAEAFDKFLK